MLGETIGATLSNAVGVAISPIPVIAVILMLFCGRAAVNGLAFSLGWVLALSTVGLLVLALGLGGTDGEPSAVGRVVKLVVGAAFLALAARQWRGRPRDGEEPRLPGWMAAVDGFTPWRAFGTALLLGGVNPKNLGLTVSAATTIGDHELAAASAAVALGVFVLVASVSVVGPVGYYLAAGSRAEAALQNLRAWLTANNNAVMSVLFLVLGAKVLGEGLAGLG